MVKLALAPGVLLWREKFSPVAQKALLDEVFSLLEQAPLYRPVMPKTGKAFSVEESNFGRLGWVSDRNGYRYQPTHPVTGKAWPAIPSMLLELWNEIATPDLGDPLRPSLAPGREAPQKFNWRATRAGEPATATSPSSALRAQGEGPDCCLINLYRQGAKMGLHQDRDERDVSAPVVGISLGDDAIFRIGGTKRGGVTQSIKLASGDVILFGGPARLAYHGIDRVAAGSSRLVPGGGRLSLTLRRVK